MKYFSWIITLPVTVVVVIFALSNMHEVTFGLWPFDDTFTLELFIAVLATFLVGFLCGGIVVWFSDGKVRRRARKAEFEAAGLKQENANLKHQAARQAAERAHKASAPAAGAPAAGDVAPLQIAAGPGGDSPPARLTGS